MNVDIEQARSLNQSPTKTAGAQCRFYKLSDTLGLKVYRDEEFGHLSHALQTKAHSLGLAPACGELIIDKDFVAYTTEIVDVANDRAVRQCRADGNVRSFAYYINHIDEGELLKKFDKLVREDNRYYDAYHDMHDDNWGYLPDGTVVCIDFGY